MLGLAERPMVAVLSMRLPCGAVWCRLRPRQGIHLPALSQTSLIFLEILPHQSGEQQRQRHRVAVLRLRRRRRGLHVRLEVAVSSRQVTGTMVPAPRHVSPAPGPLTATARGV